MLLKGMDEAEADLTASTLSFIIDSWIIRVVAYQMANMSH